MTSAPLPSFAVPLRSGGMVFTWWDDAVWWANARTWATGYRHRVRRGFDGRWTARQLEEPYR